MTAVVALNADDSKPRLADQTGHTAWCPFRRQRSFMNRARRMGTAGWTHAVAVGKFEYLTW